MARWLAILLLMCQCCAIDVGTCCTPDPELKWFNVSSNEWENRKEFIVNNCHCLRDQIISNGTLQEGEYKHYHWTLTNYSLINDPKGGKVTFLLVPCRGKAQIFAKPAVLGDGKQMNQLFETVAEGDYAGKQSQTWPFPDNTTGILEQGADDRMVGGDKLGKMKWGLNGTKAGYENALTFRIQHGGYLISVFAETNATFQIMAYTHEGTKNPLKEAHEGIALQRRNSLLSEWENGELRVKWNSSDEEGEDEAEYQLYMVKMPVDDGAIEPGRCGQSNADLETNSAADLIQHSSKCILWTQCGLQETAVKVGGALKTKDVGGLVVSLNDAKCQMPDNPDGGEMSDCAVEKDVPYYFTVVRTRGLYQELYLGLGTISSYESIRQLQSDSTILLIGVCAGLAVLALMICICMIKKRTQHKLYAVYRQAQVQDVQKPLIKQVKTVASTKIVE